MKRFDLQGLYFLYPPLAGFVQSVEQLYSDVEQVEGIGLGLGLGVWLRWDLDLQLEFD